MSKIFYYSHNIKEPEPVKSGERVGKTMNKEPSSVCISNANITLFKDHVELNNESDTSLK